MASYKITATIVFYSIHLLRCDILSAVDDTCRTCFLVGPVCYNLTHLFDLSADFRNEVVIRKMDVLRSSNRLFYSYEPTIEDEEYYRVAHVNLDHPRLLGVVSVRSFDGTRRLLFNFGTFHLDQDNDMVYLGGSDGIYKLDAKTGNLSFYSSSGDRITSLVFKGNVFFTKYSEDLVLEKRGDSFVPVPPMIGTPVKNFMIDKTNAFVYLSTKGLFVTRDGVSHRLSDNPFFRGMASDATGNIYTWWIDTIYAVHVERNVTASRLSLIFQIPRVKGVAFDRDNNMIVALDKRLIKIQEVDVNHCIIYNS